MNNIWLKITATGASMGLVSIVYANISGKQKNKLASELLRELTKVVKPATAGLVGEDAFDIDYVDEVLKNVRGRVITLKKETATKFAERIHNAWGAWYVGGDDESKVYSVFRELKDKVQVSQVTKAYQDEHKINLIDKLNERFDDAEVKKVLDIVKPLPAYRKV